MQRITLDETDYTTILAGSLNEYVKRITGQALAAPSTPHSKRQSYKNLDKSSCFDLIQRISESSLLVLEVKVTHDGIKLRSFNKQQRKVDSALREAGIPIEYCYNTTDDYLEVNNAEYTLLETMSSHPSYVSDDSGNIHHKEHHLRLKALVDMLMDTTEGNAGMIGALFSKGLMSRMRELNIKALFFAANAGDIDLYTDDDLFDIYESYKSHVYIGKGINLNTATYAELVSEFQACAEKLNKLITKWQKRKYPDNSHSITTPPSFGL
ncbi:hypothetical protein UXA55_07060 [Aeromonas caviae]|uniref:hypothetical protein n=1 Tax=Aeromonas TaxID=642 RepID=UPI002907D75D|nr:MULTISPECIES: hypothetical protein [Aeromonas]MDU7579015.1 hypothetical protein [Aeromonas sp.]MDX7787287.1 hypothetical protein [Aeromonas caviae]MDY7829348.1 hypothetical protein [Aeromonas caviae]